MARKKPLYGYFSHHHAKEPGCTVSVYRTPSGREVMITERGHTKIAEESGYGYPQTFTVGKITTKWHLIDEYTVPGSIDPEHLEDPEEEYLAA